MLHSETMTYVSVKIYEICNQRIRKCSEFTEDEARKQGGKKRVKPSCSDVSAHVPLLAIISGDLAAILQRTQRGGWWLSATKKLLMGRWGCLPLDRYENSWQSLTDAV